jgi:hypothetical protein
MAGKALTTGSERVARRTRRSLPQHALSGVAAISRSVFPPPAPPARPPATDVWGATRAPQRATGAAQPRGAGAGVAGPRSRRDNQRRKPRDEGERRKVDGGRAIAPGPLEVEADSAVVEDAQPVVGVRRAQDAPAQPLPAGLVVGGDARGSLQVESAGLRAERALARRSCTT